MKWLCLNIRKSHDSSVGIALGYGLNDRGSRVRFPAGLGIFLFTTASRTALGPTQFPIQWILGVLSLGVKRPGRETDHSPPCSAEVKNAWSYTPTPQYIFMAWCLVKHRDFTFTLTSVILMLSKKLIGLILCLRIFHEAKLKIVGPNFIRKVEMKMYIQTRRN
jgi:hypothetical protein